MTFKTCKWIKPKLKYIYIYIYIYVYIFYIYIHTYLHINKLNPIITGVTRTPIPAEGVQKCIAHLTSVSNIP